MYFFLRGGQYAQDAEGIARVAALLRSLPKATVLITSQADSAASHLFDVVDRVFKEAGGAVEVFR